MAKGPGGFSVGRVSIQVVPDTSGFRKKLKTELEKAVRGLEVKVPVNIDAKRAVTQLKALDTILKRLNGRRVDVSAQLNSRGDLDSIAKKLKNVSNSASDAADGFGRMSRFAMVATAVVLLLAPALALIATLLAGLPSLMLAFGAGALAVGLGIDGIKKAASGFTPTIERLKASLSATFAKQLTQPFIELNKIAPVLDSGLNKIAVSISGIISDMIKFMTSTEGMKALDQILQNTATFFNALRPAISDGMRAFFQLASVASTEFVGLAATFNRFSKSFADMVARVADNGVLTSALRNLNMVLDSLLEAFVRFFEAGLESMTVLGGPITQLFVGFTDAIVALMGPLTQLSKLVFEVLGEALKQLAPIIDAIAPAFETLAKLLGTLLIGALKALGPLLTRIAEIMNQVFIKAFAALTPIIDPLIQFMSQLSEILAEFLLQAFILLSPFLDEFLRFVTDLLIQITPLLPAILELATVVFKALLDVFREISPELMQLTETALPALLQIVKDLTPFLIQVIDILVRILPPIIDFASTILDIAVPALQSLWQVVREVWPSIKQIIEGVLLAIQGIINLIMGIITGDWERAGQGLREIAQGWWTAIKGATKAGITAVLEFMIAFPARILNTLLGLPQQFFESGRRMMQGLLEGIRSMGQAVVNSALAVVERVRGLLPFSPAKYGPFSGQGYTLYSGRALMEDWAKGIQDGAPAAVRAVEDAMTATQTGMDLNAAVTTEGFGDLQGQIMSALSGWEVVIDANGITKLVNKTNQRNSRR